MRNSMRSQSNCSHCPAFFHPHRQRRMYSSTLPSTPTLAYVDGPCLAPRPTLDSRLMISSRRLYAVVIVSYIYCVLVVLPRFLIQIPHPYDHYEDTKIFPLFLFFLHSVYIPFFSSFILLPCIHGPGPVFKYFLSLASVRRCFLFPPSTL